jgi:hypothetical protein
VISTAEELALRAWYRGAFGDRDDDRRYLTPAECAAEMGLETATVERMALAGELRRIRHAGGWLIEPAIINTVPRLAPEMGQEG